MFDLRMILEKSRIQEALFSLENLMTQHGRIYSSHEKLSTIKQLVYPLTPSNNHERCLEVYHVKSSVITP
jgi:hypothetical protein